ncbi:calcium-transporting ATPase [Auriculariales sp. MPI-PUGE-AT-0066]|nr:calcium-transporting ATPase [Auriculariales sp. MPI-PUGE-AT-0066]
MAAYSKDGKKRQNQHFDSSASTSTTAFSMYPASSQHRDPSPPASAYFVNPTLDPLDDRPPVPTADAGPHFAYSTTLRRHPGEFEFDTSNLSIEDTRSIVTKVWHAIKHGSWSYIPVNDQEGGHSSTKPPPETPAGKFAYTSPQETLSHLRSSMADGLSSLVVQGLRERHGYNEFSVATPEPLLLKFVKTIYESPLNLLLLGSAVVSAGMGNIDDAISITVAILIVLTVGFVQERRSEKSLDALNKLVPHHCHLIRDGRPAHLLANELVPGDIVKFSVGDRVPADVRLLEAVDLEIDESSLTGETRAISKTTDALSTPNAALADRTCVAYMGTLVRNGRGTGIVVGTGEQTEFGVIFTMMQDVEEKRTPLQLHMDELAKRLSMASFAIIGVICVVGWIQGRHWLEMFTIGVSLAVAAIPEGLPIVTTVTLALGVLRMSKRKAIVKKLPSVEALGCVSVICSDKTGTLTKNEQTVTEAFSVDEIVPVDFTGVLPKLTPALRRTFEIAAVCNNAFRNEENLSVGQATDVALLNAAYSFGFGELRNTFQRSSEKPFNSEQKYMMMTYIKGSIEAVLERCRFYFVSDEATPGLDAQTRSLILSRAEGVAARGLRVLAMAYAHGSASNAAFIFAGFAAMRDPPRRGVSDAISDLHKAGVQVIMITGDAEQTALSIAREIGLRVQPGNVSCLTGAVIDGMNRAQLRDALGTVTVFARTTPRHKMAIVEALQARGAVVAMTGDGVNDAPALKLADIGISMGKSGTDVAKEAADVILVNDDFTTILSAIEEGKGIFHNIQNFLSFQLSTAVAALSLITLSTFFRLSNPLNAMQILFINILMDGPPSQSLGVDPVDPAVMKKPPRKKDEEIITQRLLTRVLFSACMIVLGTLFVYAYELSDGLSHRDQTMTFTTFVFLDLVSALQNRGLGCGMLQNRMLLITVSTSFCAQLALIYVPFMQAVFQTEALALQDLLHLLALAATSFSLHELRRRYERRLDAVHAASAYSRVEELA